MQTTLITYTVKSKQNGFIWVFKYHLNGKLASFELMDSELTEKQEDWLNGRFPFQEKHIIVWQQKLKQNFEIVKAEPILDFDSLWELYGLKVKRQSSEAAFKKLSPAEKVKCFLALPAYFKHLTKSREAKAHLVTWINQKRFNDEY
ncbi:hypothetical protein [Flavobacterium sp. N1994]|uniref:hypothetical protein n=1 Tax=Flavobacterium sp. N1994 TaxID=2986827 RepID=UPI0022218ED4|nr:hypothetical protein [Flavobacterium sp. N1994]